MRRLGYGYKRNRTFIAERRKQKGLTQKELAERLQVSELLSGKQLREETDIKEQTDQITAGSDKCECFAWNYICYQV